MWVHAASVGEFEQARPVISALKKSHPDIAVFVSFLSDSGYNARKNYPDADAVFYLPADTPENAEKTASLVKADIFMLMRYDFWPNHLLAAKRHGATMILAAAVLRPGSAYFNPLLKGFYRTVFNLFDRIFTVSENDARAFRERFGCIRPKPPESRELIRLSAQQAHRACCSPEDPLHKPQCSCCGKRLGKRRRADSGSHALPSKSPITHTGSPQGG